MPFRSQKVQITSANGVAFVPVGVGTTNGTKVRSILLSSIKNATSGVQLAVTSGGTDYRIATMDLPNNCGTSFSAGAAIDAMPFISGLPSDADGPYLPLKDTDTLMARSTPALGVNEQVNVVSTFEDL